jgi:hypothetical protein
MRFCFLGVWKRLLEPKTQNGYLLYPKTTSATLGSGGKYQREIDGLIRYCGTAFASVDPEKWKTELLLPLFGIG